MIITNLLIEFELPFVSSLKERRAILNSIKEKLKKFNISILDISGEYAKEAAIALVFLSPNETLAKAYVQKIDQFLYRNWSEINFDISYELI